MNDIERLWTTARNRHGEFKDRRTPSAGIACVLTTLWQLGSAYGSEIACEARQDQGNTARWLAKLRLFGLIEVVEELSGAGHQGGGRPAIVWHLTRSGRELAVLLAQDADGVAA